MLLVSKPVFYFLFFRCYISAIKRKEDNKMLKVLKEFFEAYYEECAHK